MAEYDNTNSGALFINDRKQKETHPDYTGKINVGGKDFYLKGWKKTAKSGTSFLSLALDAVDKGASDPKAPSAPTIDEAPF